jgi:hypothetical protein
MTKRYFLNLLVLVLAASAFAADPVLSDRVRKLIADKGVEAARQEAPMLVVAAQGEPDPDEKGMLALADDYLVEGNVEAAELVVHLQMMIGLSPDVAAKLGDVYMAKGVPFAASNFYRQALQADPGHEHARSQLDRIAREHPEVPDLSSAGERRQPAATDPEPAGDDDDAAAAKATPDRPARKPGPENDLLPYVLVADPDEVDSLDWEALRQRAGTDYPSRWDDLTLVDSCLWISPEELREYLGLSERLTAKRADFQCKYWVHDPNGESEVALQIYVERHATTKRVREIEADFSERFPSRQFTPLDPGARDLKAYVNNKGTYLYVFPENGITMWRIGYKPRNVALRLGLGPRFLQLLVQKYADHL